MSKLSQKILKQAKTRAQTVRQKAAKATRSLDRKLLSMTSSRIDKVKSRLSEAGKKIDLDAHVSTLLGSKVLERAMQIRQSLQADEMVKKSLKKKEEIQKKVTQKALKAQARARRQVSKVKKKAQSLRA